MAKISVVIPTIGRADYTQAIRSAIRQTTSVHEIILVDSSPAGIDHSLLPSDPRLKVLRRDSKAKEPCETPKWSAAENRNLGIKESSGDFVALLDDDDEWMPSKIETQLSHRTPGKDEILSCRARYKGKYGLWYPRPIFTMDDSKTILETFYGKRSFFPLLHYIATPTVMVPTDIAKAFPIDETLPGFEDTWWMHELESKGLRVKQLREILVQVNATPYRSIGRDTIQKNLAWAEKISDVDSRYGFNFLAGICRRNALLLGRWSELKELKSLAQNYSKD